MVIYTLRRGARDKDWMQHVKTTQILTDATCADNPALTVDIESYQQFSIDSIVIIKSTKYNPLVVQPSCQYHPHEHTTSLQKGSRAAVSSDVTQ